MEAAIDLLSAEGLAGTTVRAVCARAGLNSRYFYESFPDIDALLVSVFEQLSSDFLDYITEAAESAGNDPTERLRAVMRATAQIVEERTSLVRILTVEAIASEELNRRRIGMLHRIAEMIEEDARRSYGDPPPGDQLTAVAARFLAGGLAELFVAWVGGALEGSMEELARDAVDVVLAFSQATRNLAADRGWTGR